MNESAKAKSRQSMLQSNLFAAMFFFDKWHINDKAQIAAPEPGLPSATTNGKLRQTCAFIHLLGEFKPNTLDVDYFSCGEDV